VAVLHLSARIRLDKTVALVNAIFASSAFTHIGYYATAPAGRKNPPVRFSYPEPGNSCGKVSSLATPTIGRRAPWFDTTIGAQYLSRRGSKSAVNFAPGHSKILQSNTLISASSTAASWTSRAFAIHKAATSRSSPMQSLLPHRWRFVADINELTSLTFRLAFADTYGDAINSEVPALLFSPTISVL